MEDIHESENALRLGCCCRLVLSTTKLISHNSFRTSVTIIQTIYSRKINQMDEKAESVWD